MNMNSQRDIKNIQVVQRNSETSLLEKLLPGLVMRSNKCH